MLDPLQQEEHQCKILYIYNKRSTHLRFSISTTRGAHILDPLYLQQEESHVRFYLFAARGASMEDPLYLQQEEHSCKNLYI